MIITEVYVFLAKILADIYSGNMLIPVDKLCRSLYYYIYLKILLNNTKIYVTILLNNAKTKSSHL